MTKSRHEINSGTNVKNFQLCTDQESIPMKANSSACFSVGVWPCYIEIP